MDFETLLIMLTCNSHLVLLLRNAAKLFEDLSQRFPPVDASRIPIDQILPDLEGFRVGEKCVFGLSLRKVCVAQLFQDR